MKIKVYNNNKVWYYRVKKEDEKLNNNDFFKRYNFSLESFMHLNPNFTSLKAGKVLLMPPSSKYYHVVGPLENIESIAAKYQCDMDYLKSLNNVNSLFIGQKLFL